MGTRLDIKPAFDIIVDPVELTSRVTTVLDAVGVTSYAPVELRSRWGVLLAKRDPALADFIACNVMPRVSTLTRYTNQLQLELEVSFPYPFSRFFSFKAYYAGREIPEAALYTDILCAFESVDEKDLDGD